MADRGSSTLTAVVLVPVFVALAFMAFQVSMWTHATAEVRAAARHAAVDVARRGVDPEVASAHTETALSVGAPVVQPRVSILADGTDEIAVTITARAPGILRGTSTDIAVTELVPREGWRP